MIEEYGFPRLPRPRRETESVMTDLPFVLDPARPSRGRGNRCHCWQDASRHGLARGPHFAPLGVKLPEEAKELRQPLSGFIIAKGDEERKFLPTLAAAFICHAANVH
jgi:hypothetical protein